VLAKDSSEQKREGGFSLLVNAGCGVAELIAECGKCGAITMYGLEAAWRLHDVTRPECATSMRFDGGRREGAARGSHRGARSARRADARALACSLTDLCPRLELFPFRYRNPAHR